MQRQLKFIFANKNDKGEWDMSFPLTFDDIISGGHVDTFDENTVVREWTGLHDKNGKEIYEGDVVESVEKIHAVKTTCTYTMVEDKHVSLPRLCYALENDVARGAEIEIIGNIYENPDLISSNVVSVAGTLMLSAKTI